MIIGEVLNSRCDIKMLIGDGGMANVYLAYDRILRKNVAVKMLRYELSKDESFIKRFNREAIQVTTLDHPNVVASYAVGQYEEQPYIVMEYIKGKTLKDYLREHGSLTAEEAIHVMTQICQGVDHAHEKGIIHRDLKSQNIMVDTDLNVKITDFGIALSSNEADMTQTNTIMGSVHYLAPELARGNIATSASDIYSLGILLYELLTGCVPFKGEGAVNIALQHMEGCVPSVREMDESLFENFDFIIKKATQKRPTNRYPDALEMIEDLRVAHIEGAVSDFVEDEFDKTMVIPTILDDSEDPEMEEDMVKSKKKRVALLSMINAFLFTILIGVLGVAYFIVVVQPGFFSTDHATVPNLIGLNEDEAQEALDDNGLEIATLRVIPVRNSMVNSGEVFRSTPAQDTRVRVFENMEIVIYVAE